MKTIDVVTLVIVIIGALNWGLVGLAEVDVVAKIFGDGSGAARVIYIIVGLCGLYQILPLFRVMQPSRQI